MARSAAFLAAAILVAAVALPAHCQTVPVNGANVQPVKVEEPTIHDSSQPDKPTVTPVDQTFTEHDTNTGDSHVGLANGKPSAGVEVHPNPSGLLAGKRLLAFGRKLLQVKGAPNVFDSTLDLSGKGASAGDKDAGVATNAYGHGNSNGPGSGGTHIQPHGANVDPSVAGKQVDTTAAYNPDGLAGEGPVTTVGKR